MYHTEPTKTVISWSNDKYGIMKARLMRNKTTTVPKYVPIEPIISDDHTASLDVGSKERSLLYKIINHKLFR